MLLALVPCVLGASSDAQDAAEASASASSWRSARDEILVQSVASLEALADWCNSNEVFVERDRVFELILRIDPEHFRAHKGLKHVQTRDGKWVPPEKRVVSKNFNPIAAGKFPERMRTTLAPTCDALFALVDRSSLAGADRDSVYEDIVRFDPDNARVRQERGEARLDGAWVLQETLAGKVRRPEVKAAVRAALAGVPEPAAFALGDDEPTLALHWKVSVRTPTVRVLSTGDAAEAVKLAKYASATLVLLHQLFALPAKERAAFTVYALGGAEERVQFIAIHPDIDPEQRAALAEFSGMGLNFRGDFAISSTNAEERLDSVVRQTIAHALIDEFRIEPSFGWAFEGFGMYLTRELTGTRMTWFSLPNGANAEQIALRKKLIGAKSNWMNDAHELLESPRKPDLGALVAKGIDGLTIEELLYAYVLAAYLIEARAVETPTLLRALADAKAVEDVFRQVLGMDFAATDARVRRWLSERR
ncbi:MAG: hypothetical protein HZA52_02680 [Planctomycetes bacterium]|nr:hypothetical protein [Planctomycetota bacterium]